MVSRLLAQYFIDNQLQFTGFDTDRSHGSLLRFYADFASPVLIDRYEAMDRVVESAIEQPGTRVLVDLAAQTHAPLVTWMEDSGLLEIAAESGLAFYYWHVMDSGRDSVDLLSKVLDRFGNRLQHVLVLNELRGNDFSQLEKSGQLERALALGAKQMSIRPLHQAVVQKIDAGNVSFWAAKAGNANLGLLERQRLKIWLQHAYEGFAAVGA
jgi:hypothetical protein